MTSLARYRKDFPILQRKVHGKRLVYLDSAATAQLPKRVLDAMQRYYTKSHSNVHRGVHTLAQEATTLYEDAHASVARFAHVSPSQLIFTRNTTESLNMAARMLEQHLQQGDEIMVTQLEHHSNLVPWQQVCQRTGAQLRIVRILPDGTIDQRDFTKKISKRTKVVSFTHMSNVLGTITPVRTLAKEAHDAGAHVVVDGAQAAPHLPLDLSRLGADLYAFSSHKMLGPTGVGALVGTPELLEDLEPVSFGGGMIKTVSFTKSTWNDVPWKFEAGTPMIADAVGFGAAVQYLQKIGMERIQKHEEQITRYALQQLRSVPHVTIYGPEERGSLVSFNYGKIHAHDVATIADTFGVAIRAGHLCAMPLVREVLKIPAVARASFYLYTTKEDIDCLVQALHHIPKVFHP